MIWEMQMIKKMPIDNIYYDGNVPIFLYDFIISAILDEEKCQIRSSEILIIDG